MGLASVMSDIAPMYEKPSPQAVRTDELLYGASVQVIQQSDTGWCYLRTERHTEGYVPSAALQLDANVAAAWRKYKKTVVLAPYVDVQKEPDNEAPRVASLPRGGILVALAAAGADGWQKVGLVNGSVGYTRASYLGEVIANWEELEEGDLRWNLVETALSYNGAAWRTGGRTPLGMDPAGLIGMTYLINGVVLPQPMGFVQGSPLQPVDVKQMGEGDVLYFSAGAGIYIGDNRFIHVTDLSGSEGVVVSSLRAKDEDYRADLAGQIRAVGSLFY